MRRCVTLRVVFLAPLLCCFSFFFFHDCSVAHIIILSWVLGLGCEKTDFLNATFVLNTFYHLPHMLRDKHKSEKVKIHCKTDFRSNLQWGNKGCVKWSQCFNESLSEYRKTGFSWAIPCSTTVESVWLQGHVAGLPFIAPFECTFFSFSKRLLYALLEINILFAKQCMCSWKLPLALALELYD